MRGLEKVAADRREAIARQVRVVSSGFTWGRLPAGGAMAVVARLQPALKAAAPSQAEARAEAVRRAERLLDLLRAWPAEEPLASATELGRRLGMAEARGNAVVEAVGRAFLRLEADGVLLSVSGTRERFRGQRAVLLREPRRLLQTPDAPAFWEQVLRGAMP